MRAPLKPSAALQMAAPLTTTEEGLVRLVMRGGTNRDVAAQLGVCEQTVKNRLSRLFRKIGVRNRVELAMFGSLRLRERL